MKSEQKAATKSHALPSIWHASKKKRKPVMDFLLAYLRQNMSSIWLGTESTIRSTRCWGNAP